MPSRAGDRAIDANLMAANKKIVELKKKILLAGKLNLHCIKSHYRFTCVFFFLLVPLN